MLPSFLTNVTLHETFRGSLLIFFQLELQCCLGFIIRSMYHVSFDVSIINMLSNNNFSGRLCFYCTLGLFNFSIFINLCFLLFCNVKLVLCTVLHGLILHELQTLMGLDVFVSLNNIKE